MFNVFVNFQSYWTPNHTHYTKSDFIKSVFLDVSYKLVLLNVKGDPPSINRCHKSLVFNQVTCEKTKNTPYVFKFP